MGVSPERLVIAGSSAGGNLATRQPCGHAMTTGPRVAGQVLIYPVTDHTTETESYDCSATATYYLSADQMICLRSSMTRRLPTQRNHYVFPTPWGGPHQSSPTVRLDR